MSTLQSEVHGKAGRTNRGFTLIELLVVIAIIAILAALLFPAGQKIMQAAAKKRAQAELNQVAAAIYNYKAKLGFYPPDRSFFSGTNTLYFELAGCVAMRDNNNQVTNYVTLNRSFFASPGQLAGLGATGIMNSSSTWASDDGATAQSFIKEVKGSQFGTLNGLPVLGVQIVGVQMVGNVTTFQYNSSNPANNVNSFDLWVDIVVGGKTNRISNWSDKPQVL